MLLLMLLVGIQLLQLSHDSEHRAAIFTPPAAFFSFGIVSRQRQGLLHCCGGRGEAGDVSTSGHDV